MGVKVGRTVVMETRLLRIGQSHAGRRDLVARDWTRQDMGSSAPPQCTLGELSEVVDGKARPLGHQATGLLGHCMYWRQNPTLCLLLGPLRYILIL